MNAARTAPQQLDKISPVPLYYQLFVRLRSDIQTGIARPGDLLGTEREIQERYGVSRATVRKALDELTRTGQLVRVTGRGTFVAEPPLDVHSPHLLSFTEEMHRRGVVPGAQVLIFECVPCPRSVAEPLGCRDQASVLHLRRLRTGDGTPIVLVDHYLAPGISIRREDLRESLYVTLEEVLGTALPEAYHTVRAGLATQDEARELGIAQRDAVLRFERTTISAQGRPVVWEQGTARADLYDYSVHLFRR